MRKILFLTISIFAVNITSAQKCNCKQEFEWIKTTFEQNDAGFQYVIDKKGKTEYENFNLRIYNQLDTITDIVKCNTILNEWSKFFRNGHLNISFTTPENSNQPAVASKKVNFTKADFDSYLKSTNLQPYEGIWKFAAYTIGIKKINQEFIGFIIESKNPNWKLNEVKLKFSINRKNEVDGSFFYGDHSLNKFSDAKVVDDEYINLNGNYLKKVNYISSNKKNGNDKIAIAIKSLSAEKPYLDKLNNTTLLLRIPSFDESNTKFIDSIVKQNFKLLTSIPNLIVDIRNNGGGSDECYYPLLPIIYTNPIRSIGVEIYSTTLNNARFDKLLKSEDFDAESKKNFAKGKEIVMKHLGEFVNTDSEKFSITTFPKVNEFPKNIAVLINERNGSTAEEFLLAAKQSRKVKLYGTTTFGVLDISNMNFVTSPSGLFELGYSLSRSFRIPKMTIDSKGIIPDFYLDESIPDENWIDYVDKLLNNK
jgi:Peptidase family S41